MNLNSISNKLLTHLVQKFNTHDKLVFKRKRKLNTYIIFKLLFLSTITNTGISTLAQSSKLCTYPAIIKARKLFQSNLFYNINSSLPFKNKIYAIDGSKIKIHHGFLKYGYTARTCDSITRPAKRPLAMLSALIGIQTDTITNYTITKHFNERKCVPYLTQNLNFGDIIIMDRGYFSSQLYYYLYSRHFTPIFRLKKDANRTVSLFYRSKYSNMYSFINYNNFKIPIRYVKYRIENHIYMLATIPNGFSIQKLKKLYALRWRVEVSFKRLKSYLNLNTIHATTPILWKQELQLRILIDSLTRKSMCKTKKQSYNHNYKFILFHYLIYNKIIEYGIT